METHSLRTWLKQRLEGDAQLEAAVKTISQKRQKPGERRLGPWVVDRRGDTNDAPARVVYDLQPAGDDHSRCGTTTLCRIALSVELVFDGEAALGLAASSRLLALLEGVSASDATYEWDISRSALIDDQDMPDVGGWQRQGALWLVEVRKK